MVWTQNRWRWFLLVWLQNRWLQVFWFGRQNQQLRFGDLSIGLCLKTNRAMVCRVCHKIDGRMKTVWDTRQDLAACFVWNQVGLRFLSLASRLLKA
jgi:hypothetical protein